MKSVRHPILVGFFLHYWFRFLLLGLPIWMNLRYGPLWGTGRALMYTAFDAHCVWCTLCLMHIDLMHTAFDTHCFWCTLLLMHTAFGAHCIWCTLNFMHIALDAHCTDCINCFGYCCLTNTKLSPFIMCMFSFAWWPLIFFSNVSAVFSA